MVRLQDLLEILGFQLSREITNLAKLSLERLESEKEKRIKLENILLNLGFEKDENKELLGADEDFKNNRKMILDNFMSRNREIQELISKFNVDIGNK